MCCHTTDYTYSHSCVNAYSYLTGNYSELHTSDMELTDWIGRAFRDSGLTGKALEERTERLGLKIPQPTISRIIAGRHDPSFSKVVVLAKALGLGDLLSDRSDKGKHRLLSEDEEIILDALPLIDGDLRDSWITSAKKAIERAKPDKKSLRNAGQR